MRVGKVPSQWNASNVVPIHKKGDKSNMENYRPISLLICAFKVIYGEVYF